VIKCSCLKMQFTMLPGGFNNFMKDPIFPYKIVSFDQVCSCGTELYVIHEKIGVSMCMASCSCLNAANLCIRIFLSHASPVSEQRS
jgi:hypothetical protein